ncbi:hypothetical protein [Phenylobacterium sp.]|uniref:hypothetical protein n=1 Tax=Phenylobacterium sp. TaxID=1871053 RepID=UPI002723B3DE|nr:hypothetical protein [Phenylobacterium sp.]MDO8380645.1 hypothetical protein [Phenylobacterium sp.]
MRRLACLGLVLALLAGPAAAQEAKTPQDRAIGALTVFAVAYAAWIWEGRCHELDGGRRTEFQRLIEADLLGLNQVFEPRIVGAATGSGRDTGESAECGGKNAGLAAFGIEQASDVAATLKGLPPGYRITVTP